MIAILDPADLHVGEKIGFSIHNDNHSTKKLRPIRVIPYCRTLSF